MEFQQCVVLYKPDFHTSYSIRFYPNWLYFSTRNMSSNVGTWMWRTEREERERLSSGDPGQCWAPGAARVHRPGEYSQYLENRKWGLRYLTESTSKWQIDLHVVESLEFCCSDSEIISPCLVAECDPWRAPPSPHSWTLWELLPRLFPTARSHLWRSPADDGWGGTRRDGDHHQAHHVTCPAQNTEIWKRKE